MDMARLQRYYDQVSGHSMEWGNSPFHRSITDKVVKELVLPLGLPANSVIYNIGCNMGYFVDAMNKAGYSDIRGVAFPHGDLTACSPTEHDCGVLDFLSLDCPDSTADFIFARHVLSCSPFPIFTLLEYNRAIKPGGLMYVEVASPDGARKHEFSLYHFSILGDKMWRALFLRAGFEIIHAAPLTVGLTNAKTQERYDETYLTYILQNRWK